MLWAVNFAYEYSNLRIVKWFESESMEEVAVYVLPESSACWSSTGPVASNLNLLLQQCRL